MHLQSNNKRIAKNTLLLYFRMFITMCVGLYTSRITLNLLGVSDYGINNVVGGVVAMASFLNSGLTGATQRFLSYEIGRGDDDRLGKVFNTSLVIHCLMALVILVISETIGLWFVNHCLNIDGDRMVAANWVYQFSIFSFIVSIISVPYNSCIVAHEHMSAFAYISILEAAFKLLVAFSLIFINMDKLILFAFLGLCVSIIIRMCYNIYCKLHFAECKTKFVMDKSLFGEMTSFSGWSMLGSLGFIGRDQGANIILNIFTGTVLNAARGIGLQVSILVNLFSVNFTMAMNPQITKQYAAGDLERCSHLVYEGAKFSFYLLAIISIPVIINVDYLLYLWLGKVPPYTSQFLILSLIVSMLYCLTQTVTVAIQATQKMMTFQIGICIILFLELPFVWLILIKELPPYYIMFPQIVSSVIAIVFRFYLLKKYIPYFSWSLYVFEVLIRSIAVIGISWYLSLTIHDLFEDSFINLIITSFIAAIITGAIIYILGLTKREKMIIHKSITNIIRGFQKHN